MLTTVTILFTRCYTDHGGCLGRCDGGDQAPPSGIQLQLPISMANMLLGRRFHMRFDDGRWVFRDYDCLIVETGADVELTALRFLASMMELKARTLRSGDAVSVVN